MTPKKTKTKTETTKRNLRRKRSIAADVKKLTLGLNKLQKDLKMYRHFCD
jgi:hypothetical protein